jgi:hypothetical protein
MSKLIPLSRNKFSIVDDSDYEWLSAFKWKANPSNKNSNCYAGRNVSIGGRTVGIKMHRLILGARDEDIVDHKNLNGLDNRRENLRIATSQQNAFNHPIRRTNTSGYKGVYLNKSRGKWVAQITLNYKTKNLGYFSTREDAAKVRNEAARIAHGEFYAP